MELSLNTGVTFECRDDSNENCIIIICPKADAEGIDEKITGATIKNARLGDQVLQDVVLENLCVGETDDGQAFITINLRKKSDIDILKERIAEQDAALIELAGLIGG